MADLTAKELACIAVIDTNTGKIDGEKPEPHLSTPQCPPHAEPYGLWNRKENACGGESRKSATRGCRVHAVLRIVEGFTVKTCDNCLFSCVADSVTWDEFKSRYGEPILESACLRAVTRPHAPMYPSHVANSQKC
jgi:hypothetical protein